MRALIVYANPNPESYSAHLRDVAIDALQARGAEVRVHDLYGDDFAPAMTCQERADYHTAGTNERTIAPYLSDVKWCDTVVFVYPTWWFNMPAMLKGWLDKVLVPEATFILPTKTSPMQPKLQNVTTLAAITTCGASWLQSKFVGEPARKTLLRGMRFICSPRCRTQYVALFKIDTSTHDQRVRYANRVRNIMTNL
ncbi:MAG: NAD(P)H-dependent oxidoreductase [Pseudomonadota bacterium]